MAQFMLTPLQREIAGMGGVFKGGGEGFWYCKGVRMVVLGFKEVVDWKGV